MIYQYIVYLYIVERYKLGRFSHQDMNSYLAEFIVFGI
jgi:hypothetical protein